MNQETLERLLIDRKLGELPTETTELLEAYLRLQPDRGVLEARVGETVRLAHLALGAREPTTGAALPPLSARVRAGASSRRTYVGRWRRHLAVAAGLLLAFFLGSSLTSPDAMHSRTPMAQSVRGPHRTAIRSSEFWSLSRLQADRASRTATRTQRVKWIGPLTPSRIGEES